MGTLNHEITEEEALRVANKYGLYNEIKELLDEGMTPEEALKEWDIQ